MAVFVKILLIEPTLNRVSRRVGRLALAIGQPQAFWYTGAPALATRTTPLKAIGGDHRRQIRVQAL